MKPSQYLETPLRLPAQAGIWPEAGQRRLQSSVTQSQIN
jgi:hypothetical protein